MPQKRDGTPHSILRIPHRVGKRSFMRLFSLVCCAKLDIILFCFTHPFCLSQVAYKPPLLRIVTRMLRCATGNYDRTVAHAECHIYNYERAVAQAKYHTSWPSGVRATSICLDRGKSRTSSHSVWSLWRWQRPHYAAGHKSCHTQRRPTRDLLRPCKQR